MKKAVVKTFEPKKGQRVIAISDIHGNLDVFQKLLKKIVFTEQDILVLVGDMLEKGPRNLDTLHYIMELEKTHQVYAILGNCDMVLLTLIENRENERLRLYLQQRLSTIHEMYRKLGYEFGDATNISEMKRLLCTHFQEEIRWLQKLPHILVAGNYYFAHAALKSENVNENSMQDVIREEAFMEQDHEFTHTVVVGHTPVTLYDTKISQNNPIFDKKKNIISIDGGNVLKLEGQLNALFIPDTTFNEVYYDSMDLLPQAVIMETRSIKEEQDSINVRWSDGAVKILRRENEFSYCKHLSSGHELWILNEVLSNYNGMEWAEEGTDYVLPVIEGDVVSVVRETSRGYLVKRDGRVGWYTGSLKLL